MRLNASIALFLSKTAEDERQRTGDRASETALYMYGDSFKSMTDALDGFLRAYPLCEKARVVQIA